MNSEAKLSMLSHAFEVWNCVAVEFRTHRVNQRSRAAVSRLGAEHTGTLRDTVVSPIIGVVGRPLLVVLALGHRQVRFSDAARRSVSRRWHPSVMTTRSRHLSVHIARPVAEVYAFASDPANLPRWAPGLGSAVVQEDGNWFVETPQGRVRVTFAPRNRFGVLDHDVVTPSGETVHVPLRVIADGDGCEVVLTLRRSPGMSDAEFDRDTELVIGDLALLKEVLEAAV